MKYSLDNFVKSYISNLHNYSFLEIIGEGANGVVCKAVQKSTGQLVAIKMLKFHEDSELQKSAYQVARFERETSLYAELNHPHIVKLLDKGYVNEYEPYAVFEYLSGETLGEWITRKKDVLAAETGILMGQVLDAIAYAHKKGIIHRDLKPDNIMIMKTGSRSHAKILDFGIGLFTRDHHKYKDNDQGLVQKMVGTPAYCAPEQLRGEPPTVKSDLYAWGLILIECLTGKKVMNGENMADVLQQQLSAENVPLPAAMIGHPLADILNRVVMKNPARRIGDAAVIYETYSKINLNAIVEKIARDEVVFRSEDQLTLANPLGWQHTKSDKRQITVVCIKLSLVPKNGVTLDLETFDTLQKDQLNLCRDIAMGYGGHVAGTLADNIMIYFGYPQLSDNDARMAGRTALELMNEIEKRSALLSNEHGINLDIRMGMNSGMVLSKKNALPEGQVPNTAFSLLCQSKPGQVLVSENTKRLLDPFLDFEPAAPGFLLIGERQTESLLFLNPKSAGRATIGRDREIATILDSWKQTSPDEKGILIRGQAGIGKSKLIYEIKQQVLKASGIVHHCRCLPEYQNNALQPIFEMLKRHLDIHETTKDNEIVSKLEQALFAVGCDVAVSLPILCSWFSIPVKKYTSYPISHEKRMKIILEILEKLILDIGKRHKFVFIIEDLHWIDPTSESFLKRLLQQRIGDKCLLVLSARPQFTSQWITELVREIELSPLDKKDIKPLVEGVLDGIEVSDAVLQLISERTDGVALYAEELTYMLYEKKMLKLVNNTYELIDTIKEIEVPPTLTGLLQARLESIGVAMETAQLAATIGREFSHDLLVKSSLKDEALVQADLDLFIKASIIYRRRKVNGTRYMFSHALIRDAAFQSMTTKPKKEAHYRIAFTLRQEFKKYPKRNVQRLAYHFHEAEKYKEAVKFYNIAADIEMQKKLGHLESLNLTNKALSIIELLKTNTPEDYDNVVEANLRIHKAAVLTNKSGWNHPEIIENYRQARDVLEDADSNHKLEFALAKGMWIYECTEGNVIEMLKLTEKMAKASKALQNNSYLAQTYDCLSQTQFFEGDFEGCIRSCQLCYSIYDQEQGRQKLVTDGLDPYIVCKSFEALARLFLGQVDQAIHILKETLKEAKSYNWPNLTMGIFAQTSRLYLYISSFLPDCTIEKNMLANLDTEVVLFQEKGVFPYWESAIRLNKVSAEALSGDSDALSKYEEARKKWAPKTSAKAYYDLIEAMVCITNKDYEKVLEITNESITFANINNVKYGLAYAYCFKAMALAGINKPSEALNMFHKAIEICKKQKSKWIWLFVSKAFKNFLLEEKIDKDINDLVEDTIITSDHLFTLLKNQNVVLS
ncbi:TOMM system kinase/cyclase fusion protein [Aquimarina sp. 2201CG1-2-11]|uniref:TOMM system kinase/cyclase fusion protein n=1 Tax=Aquimarina discodermiae TaxID=3231043 RepID=UPI00346348B8